MTRTKNTTFIVVAVALATGALFACQKQRPSSQNDRFDQIIKTYFLHNDDPKSVEASFRLCEINSKAIVNLNKIYQTKNNPEDLEKTRTWLAEEDRIDGTCKNCNDPRQEDFSEVAEVWFNKIESGSMTPKQFAYEYAFFQHRIYLKYPDLIQVKRFQDLYQNLSKGEADGCLGKAKEVVKNNEPDKSPNREKEKKSGQIKWAVWILKGIGVIIAIVVIRFLFKKIKTQEPHNEIDNRPRATESQENDRDRRVLRTVSDWATKIGQSFKNFFQELTDVPSSNTDSPMAKNLSTQVGEKTALLTEEETQQGQEPTTPESNAPPEVKPPEIPLASKPTEPEQLKIGLEQPESEDERPKPEPEKPKEEIPPEKETKPEEAKPPTPPPIVPLKEPEPAKPTGVTSTSTLYARIPSGNLFFSMSPYADYPDTPFVITLASESEGRFNLVEDQNTLERLFSMTDQLKDACELLNINNLAPGNYSSTPGQVVREGDYWRIISKLKLNPK